MVGSKWFQLEINPDLLPRSTTREQWRRMSRYLRTRERAMVALLDRPDSRATNKKSHEQSHGSPSVPPKQS